MINTVFMIKCNYKKTGVEKMEKKNILLGVCSSIAAYKSASLAHLLTKKGYNVDVIMTKMLQKLLHLLHLKDLLAIVV